MARIRSIHPAIFTDEAFAGLSMAARVLLLGVWCEADDQGVFEWKPVTLKMRIMPVDNVNVADLLLELERNNVVKAFTQDGRQFGAIRNFCKFQRPKTPKYRPLKSDDIRNYVASKYPLAETGLTEPVAFPQKEEIPPQMEEGGGKREEEKKESNLPAAKAARPSSEKFEEFWREYPKRDGDNPRKPAEKKFQALVKTGVDPDLIVSGARKASAAARDRGIYGTKFVPQAIKWLNDQRFADFAVAAFVEPVSSKYYAKDGSEQLEAWDNHARATTGKSLPRDSRMGWLVDAEWPPGYVPLERSLEAPPPPNLRSMQ